MIVIDPISLSTFCFCMHSYPVLTHTTCDKISNYLQASFIYPLMVSNVRPSHVSFHWWFNKSIISDQILSRKMILTSSEINLCNNLPDLKQYYGIKPPCIVLHNQKNNTNNTVKSNLFNHCFVYKVIISEVIDN